MTNEEYRSQFSLWAIMAAPLITSTDLSKATPETLAILTNADVIAVDQDALGVAGRRIRKDGDLEVWARSLSNGEKAVVLFNRSADVRDISVTWQDLQLAAGQNATVKDLWAKTTRKNVKAGYSARVPSHGVVMLRVTPKI